MDILKPGKLPSKKMAVFSCIHCGCKMRAAIEEGRYKHAERKGDQRGCDFVEFKCPTCVRPINVPVPQFGHET